MLALGPRRQEARKLAGQVDQLRASLAESQRKATEAVAAQRPFPTDYQQLVVLGKAVPPSDETSSLLVELSHIAKRSKVKFNSIQLAAGSGEGSSTPARAATIGGSGRRLLKRLAAPVPPTEAAASLLPLGATIGSAGLGVMPYDLSFSGNFFHVADFIHGIDSLIHAHNRNVAVDGRLVTLNGFALTADQTHPFPYLTANFSVTTYLTPPSQGVTAGATPAAATPSTATPTAETTPPNPRPRRPRPSPPPNEPAQERPGDQALGPAGPRLPRRPLLRPALAPPAAAGRGAGGGDRRGADSAEPVVGVGWPPAVTGLVVAAPSGTSNRSGELVVAKAAPGLRAYRHRLSDLHAKDPFRRASGGRPPPREMAGPAPPRANRGQPAPEPRARLRGLQLGYPDTHRDPHADLLLLGDRRPHRAGVL